MAHTGRSCGRVVCFLSSGGPGGPQGLQCLRDLKLHAELWACAHLLRKGFPTFIMFPKKSRFKTRLKPATLREKKEEEGEEKKKEEGVCVCVYLFRFQ